MKISKILNFEKHNFQKFCRLAADSHDFLVHCSRFLLQLDAKKNPPDSEL